MSSKFKAIRDIVAKYIGEEGEGAVVQNTTNTGGAIKNPTDAYALQRNRYTNMLRRKKPK